MERLRGLRFKRPLSVSFVDPAQARRLMGNHSTGKGGGTPRPSMIDEEELKLFGLLGPSEDLGQICARCRTEQVLGFYHERLKRLVVVRRQPAVGPATR